MTRDAHICGDEVEHRLVGLAFGKELHERNPETFLEDLGRIDRHGSRRDTADVGVMHERGRVALDLVVHKDRFDQVNVREMHSPASIRVIEDENVPGSHAGSRLADEIAHRVGERPEMQRGREALGDEPSVTVANCRRIVERVPDDR